MRYVAVMLSICFVVVFMYCLVAMAIISSFMFHPTAFGDALGNIISPVVHHITH